MLCPLNLKPSACSPYTFFLLFPVYISQLLQHILTFFPLHKPSTFLDKLCWNLTLVISWFPGKDMARGVPLEGKHLRSSHTLKLRDRVHSFLFVGSLRTPIFPFRDMTLVSQTCWCWELNLWSSMTYRIKSRAWSSVLSVLCLQSVKISLNTVKYILWFSYFSLNWWLVSLSLLLSLSQGITAATQFHNIHRNFSSHLLSSRNSLPVK